MRILFTPLAVTTHVFHMVPLAWALRSVGHDVRFAAQPCVIDTIGRAGFASATVGRTFDFQDEAVAFVRAMASGDRAQAARVGNPWIGAAADCAPDLVRFGQWWRPDVLVTDPMAYAGPLLADALGVPVVRQLWGPDWTASGFGMGGVPEGTTATPPWPEPLRELYDRHGARTEVDIAAFTVDPFPPSLQHPGLARRVTMRQVPFNGAGSVPEWLLEPPARPRVLLTWGTTTTTFAGDDSFLVPRILRGIAGLDVEVVVAISESDHARLGGVPTGVRVVAGMALDDLLPTCAAFVSQGGAGGMATAAVHAVPQVAVPLIADQPANAALMARAGIGTVLDPATFDEAAVAAAVGHAVFAAAPREAARRVAEEIRSLPSPAETVPHIEALAAGGSAAHAA